MRANWSAVAPGADGRAASPLVLKSELHAEVSFASTKRLSCLSAWRDTPVLPAPRQAVTEGGADVACHGPVPQAHFLRSLGAGARLEVLKRIADPAYAAALQTGYGWCTTLRLNRSGSTICPESRTLVLSYHRVAPHLASYGWPHIWSVAAALDKGGSFTVPFCGVRCPNPHPSIRESIMHVRDAVHLAKHCGRIMPELQRDAE